MMVLLTYDLIVPSSSSAIPFAAVPESSLLARVQVGYRKEGESYSQSIQEWI